MRRGIWSIILPDRRENLRPLMLSEGEDRARLELVLQYASEFRRFEIEHFWQRSIFFWGPLILAFGGIATTAQGSPRLALAIACFGAVCSLVWTLQNRGNKYWQEAWEQKVEALEKAALGVPLFSNPEPAKEDGWLAGRRYSPSRLAIILSDFVFLLFTGMILVCLWRAHLLNFAGRADLQVIGMVIGTVTFLGLVWWCGRSSGRNPLP